MLSRGQLLEPRVGVRVRRRAARRRPRRPAAPQDRGRPGRAAAPGDRARARLQAAAGEAAPGCGPRLTALFAARRAGAVCRRWPAGDVRAHQRTLLAERERHRGAGGVLRRGRGAGGAARRRPGHRRGCCAALDTGPTRRALLCARRDVVRPQRRPRHHRGRAGGPAGARRARAGPAVQRSRLEGRPCSSSGSRCPRSAPPTTRSTTSSSWSARWARCGSVLVLAALATAVAGAAAGLWASGRVLRPLAVGRAGGDAHRRAATSPPGSTPAGSPTCGRLAGAFNDMVDDLSARLERDRRFAADVSHELRSPLQTLSAATEVLRAPARRARRALRRPPSG